MSKHSTMRSRWASTALWTVLAALLVGVALTGCGEATSPAAETVTRYVEKSQDGFTLEEERVIFLVALDMAWSDESIDQAVVCSGWRLDPEAALSAMSVMQEDTRLPKEMTRQMIIDFFDEKCG